MENGFIEEKSAAVIRRAWTDSAYLGELKRDPSGVIGREFGVELPAGTTVRVLEDCADRVHLVLVDPDHLPESQRMTPRGLLTAKAWRDPAFRRALLADPNAAAAAALGVDFPAGLRLTVFEQSDDQLYIVIPARPATLTDEELDKVAGGTGFFKEVWSSTKDWGKDQYKDAKWQVKSFFWYDTTDPGCPAAIDQVAYYGGKELYKGGKKAYHALKHICHGW